MIKKTGVRISSAIANDTKKANKTTKPLKALFFKMRAYKKVKVSRVT